MDIGVQLTKIQTLLNALKIQILLHYKGFTPLPVLYDSVVCTALSYKYIIICLSDNVSKTHPRLDVKTFNVYRFHNERKFMWVSRGPFY